jgi:hypothetical protein
MAAKLATVDDRLLAHKGQARSIRNGSIVPDTASDKPQVGGMQFDCGYLSPYFVTDPERLEVTFSTWVGNLFWPPSETFITWTIRNCLGTSWERR